MATALKEVERYEVDQSHTNSKTKGTGMEEVLGSFKIGGQWSEKAPYPCELIITLDSNNAQMTLTGWRESDKGM